MPTPTRRPALKLSAVAAIGCAGLLWMPPAPAPGIVTSDAAGTHVAGPGSMPFGLDHSGVGRMFIFDGAPTPGICTCSLLAEGGGRYAITAAHCLSDGTSIIPTSVTVSWVTLAGSFTATATTALGQIHVHPLWDGDVFHGHDVAILEFDTPLDPSVSRYDLYDLSLPSLTGAPSFKVGYGTTGFGGTGDTGAFGTKRVGLNTWESPGLGVLGVATATGLVNNDHQLTYDFDRPDGMRDAFGFLFGIVDPGFGADEVMAAVGDSGGPTFVDTPTGRRIAGVASYRTRVLPTIAGPTAELLGMPFPGSPDVDGLINSSWGEFGVDADVTHPALLAFIRSVITPPCPADFNGVGGVTVQDIFDYLGAYFAGCTAPGVPLGIPPCYGSADINGSGGGAGGITVQDIFDYLAAYFAGC